MRITVVNFSGESDVEVQRVIRAVNRQIEEDFAPYWHRTGRLRLEGPVWDRPNPGAPEELRGDAILYLWNDADDEAEAIGYHQLTGQGIPYGVVYTELAKRQEGHWSVTLSHEALEILADPEANLWAEGPHPEEPERIVYHWYEVCDAVQGLRYQIDEVAVSDFLLPLYFTTADERGSRNDFLGTEELSSFGVVGGGYVGFYDPETGRQEYYHAPADEEAVERLRTRIATGLTRRTVRRHRETQMDQVARVLTGRGPDEALPGPWFEGFALDVRVGDGGPRERAASAAAAVLGEAWEREWDLLEPTRPTQPQDVQEYDLVPREPPALSPPKAWEATHRLREQPGIAAVEPDFAFFMPDPEGLATQRGAQLLGLFASQPDAAVDDRLWALEQTRIDRVWGAATGSGIVIAHPDTGYLDHPELRRDVDGGPVSTVLDADFVDPNDPFDADTRLDQDDLLPGGPGHGTATGSVIASPHDAVDPATEGVTGVAPGAILVPLRVGNSVVHFSFSNVRRAIEHALIHEMDVVSLSLGGPLPNRRLRRVLREAREAGMIVVCAAGNSIPFGAVVWPARYPEVVAVAACNVRERPWRESSRGDVVDITAPGENVWRARVRAEGEDVAPSSGTSYATAMIAGVAALWIEHHGRGVLRARYGEFVSDAFRLLLRQTAQVRPKLPADEFGGGIVNAEALLAAPLPSRDDARAFAAGEVDASGRGALRAMLPRMGEAELDEGLRSLLGATDAGVGRVLDAVGDELAFRFAADRRLARRFAAHARRAAGLRGASAAARRWRAGTYGDLRRMLGEAGSARLRAELP